MNLFATWLSLYYGFWSVLTLYEYYMERASRTYYIKDREGNRYLKM